MSPFRLMRKLLRRTKRRSGDPLDDVLFHWPRGDPFTLRDLLRSIAIFGGTGSGKTSAFASFLARAIVSHRRIGGLILAAKPEDKSMWQAIFTAAGRSDDLLIMEPGGPLRLNFLNYVLASGGDTREITTCITTIGKTLRAQGSQGREDSAFWDAEQARMIYNAVVILRLATGSVTAPDLQRFITTAARDRAQLESAAWQKQFHSQCMDLAFNRPKSRMEQHEFELAADYWLNELPNMADRTRSSIETGVFGILHVFNSGNVRDIVSGETTFSPDVLFTSGKWLLVNMPPSLFGASGTFVNAGVKFLTEWRILRREADPSGFLVAIVCDEAQQFVNDYDSGFLAQCRSHLACLCFLTQSLHSYYGAMPGDAGRHLADALLGNFNLRIFHALGDVDTAKWASDLVGRELQTFIGGSSGQNGSMFDTLTGRSQFNGSFSQHYENVLEPNVFMNGLRTGGPANGFVVDGIAIKSGEPFANGKNYLWTSFRQR